MKLGIIGAGFAAKFHYECLKKIHSVPLELTGVTSLREKSRRKFGEETGVRVFDSLEEMLPEVDVVDICVPPYAHEKMITRSAEAKKNIIVEKPFTGYFGPEGAGDDFHAGGVGRQAMLEETVASLKRINKAVKKNNVILGYAENFVYAPAIQKEKELVEKTRAQILRMTAEESHSGSHSPYYGIWRYSGGGSLIGKGCHPLTAVMYLKRVEGIARNGKPIRPAAVTSRVHELTRLPGYEDRGFIRTNYHDIEDYGIIHVIFDDGTIADVITSEIVLGGLYDWVEVFANNHRTRCRLSPTNLVDTYNPSDEQFKDIYLLEKISSKEGWSPAAPDENWTLGYQAEIQDFLESFQEKKNPQADIELATDTTLVIYAAYVSAEKKGAETAVPRIE